MTYLETCSKTEQKSVIRLLVAEQRKPSERFRRIFAMYEEACSSQKMPTNGLNYSRKNRKMFLMTTGQENLLE